MKSPRYQGNIRLNVNRISKVSISRFDDNKISTKVPIIIVQIHQWSCWKCPNISDLNLLLWDIVTRDRKLLSKLSTN